MLRAAVVKFLCKTLLSLTALSFAIPEYGFAQPTNPQGLTINNTTSNSCQDEVKNYNEGVGLIAGYCSDKTAAGCQEMIKSCESKKSSSASASWASDSEDDDCEGVRDLARECPALVGNITKKELREDRKDSEKNLKELQKERTELQTQQFEKQKQARDDLMQMDEKALQADRDYRDQRKKLMDEMQAQLAGAEDAKLKGLKEAQESYDKLDQEYINMRRDLRQAQTKMSLLESQWKVECRGEANTMSLKAEEELDKRFAAEDAQRRNLQGRSLAGKKNRRKKKKRTKIVNLFNEYLSRCMRGEVAPGGARKLELEGARENLANSQMEANDRAARLEKLRTQIQQSLDQLGQSMDKRVAQIAQQTQEALRNLDMDKMMDKQKFEQRKQQAMADMVQAQGLQQAQQKAIDDQIRTAKEDRTIANNRAKNCGVPSGVDGSSEKSNYDNARKGVQMIKSACAAWSDCAAGAKEDSDVMRSMRTLRAKCNTQASKDADNMEKTIQRNQPTSGSASTGVSQ